MIMQERVTTMKIINHRLVLEDGKPARFEESPNHGGTIKPSYIVMHFTSAGSLDSTISWFRNPSAKVSAHLVIDRDGTIVQMVPFNLKAWHAGESRWGRIEGLNSHSIGIELVNWGQLTWAAYRWKSWTGKVLQESEVKEEFIKGIKTGWQTYPDEQLKAAEDACIAISQAFPIKDILGHSDIAPGRKADPGPAFPMTAFRARVMDGKHEQQGV